MSANGNNILGVVVRSHEGLLFEGNARAVTSYNDVGPFDILGRHANFISIIRREIIIHSDGDGSRQFPLEIGILKVRENNVEVYLGLGA